jgi:asparagine synthase (glutamine-hydrolysing)
MTRRGPDDEGYYLDGGIALGMRRLAIIDVEGGHQPIANEDETLQIVFNGEIFNHEDLSRELRQRGHGFRTRSDTETILHLYEEDSTFLRRLRGMFAIAIWNARTRQLFLARDRLGIKPLHYFYDRERFAFASEIKALLQDPAIPRDIDWTAVDAYLAYGYIPAPFTAYKAIRKLPAGHYIVVNEKGVRVEAYWDLAMEPKWAASPADLEHEFVERFRECVRMRLLSEVPLGGFLSGGLDSSLVVAMMAEASSGPVRAFTIGFGGNTGSLMDERPIARDVSNHFGVEHHEIEVQPQVEQALDAALQAFDEPFADDSVIPTHHLCAAAREHVTVALTGLGGDENFAGYERYLGFRLSQLAERAPWRFALGLARPAIRVLREEANGHYRVNHLKRFIEAQGLPAAQRWQKYNEVFSRPERQALYSPDLISEIDFDLTDRMGRQYYDRTDAHDPIDRALYQDIKMYLPDDILALTDRMGMWHSLELRVPFVDHTLVEFCARIPSTLKLRWGQKKYLLRRAAAPLVPASVLNHRKQGFVAPMAAWIRGDLRAFVDTNVSACQLSQIGLLDSAEVARHVAAHQMRHRLNDKKIFAILMLQRWLTSIS